MKALFAGISGVGFVGILTILFIMLLLIFLGVLLCKGGILQIEIRVFIR
jgi:hypothetical protein